MGTGLHINDDVMPWNARRKFIGWREFMSIGNIALDGNAANIWITQGSGTTAGTPLVGEIGATSTDIAGIEIAAAGDLLSTYLPLPGDMDLSDPQLFFRVHFVHESTSADAPIWKVHYLHRAKQEGFLEPVAGATAVTTLAAHTCGTTADSLEITVWTVAATQPASTDHAIILAVEADDLGSASAGELFFLGVEIQYKADMLDDQGPAD